MTSKHGKQRAQPARPGVLPVLALALAMVAAAPLAAQQGTDQEPDATVGNERVEDAEQYRDCMAAARLAPESGLEQARSWADQGGGDPARHCEGVALLTLGEYEAAGETLEELARTMEEGSAPSLRANALAQSAQAWLLAGQPERAEAVQSTALEIAPGDVELWIDRALTRFELGAYRDAVADLNEAENRGGERADILTYRASAFRHADSLDMARSNVERALELDAENPEALLELGNLRRLQGDDDDAREVWMALIRTAPDSPAAEAARRNLERMDVEGGAE